MILATINKEFNSLNYQLKNLLWKARLLRKNFRKRIKRGMTFIKNSKKIFLIKSKSQINKDAFSKFVNLLSK